jgi:hypothetical protein
VKAGGSLSPKILDTAPVPGSWAHITCGELPRGPCAIVSLSGRTASVGPAPERTPIDPPGHRGRVGRVASGRKKKDYDQEAVAAEAEETPGQAGRREAENEPVLGVGPSRAAVLAILALLVLVAVAILLRYGISQAMQ